MFYQDTIEFESISSKNIHFRDAQLLILELIVNGATQRRLLDAICLTFEKNSPVKSIACIHLSEEKSKGLELASAPSMDQESKEQLSYVPQGLNASFGAAAFHKRKIIISDVSTSEYWEDFLEIAVRCEIKSCWSMPFLSKEGALLGTFSLIFPQVTEQDPRDEELLRVAGYMATIVVEYQLAEDKLRQRERFFRSLLENSYEALSIQNAQGVFQYVSPGIQQILDYSPGNFIGKNAFSLIHPDDLDQAHLSFQEISKHIGQVTLQIIRYKHRNGSWRDLEIRSMNLLHDPVIQGVTNNIRDITESRRAQEALKRSEERLELALQGAELGLWDWDLESGDLAFNELWVRKIERLREDCQSKGIGWSDLVHPDDVGKLFDNFQCHVKGNVGLFESEFRMRSMQGEWRWFLARGRVVKRNGEQRALRAAGTLLDITQRKKMEHQNALLESQLRQAQKMESIGQLAGGIAHDFNNFLLAILGYTDLGLVRLEPENPVFGYLNEIKKAGEKASDLIRQLLTFSRRQAINPCFFDLNQVLKDIIVVLRGALPQDIAIEYVPEKLSALVYADVSQIENAIMNLCINARDAMSEGGTLTIGTKEIVLEEENRREYPEMKAGRYLSFFISDTGKGIPREIQARIFEPFFTTKPFGVGNGLGLAMVYGVVKQHEGMIQVESECLGGTRFDILLPYTPPKGEVCQNQAKEKHTILIVDDESGLRQMVKTFLRDAHFDILEASDGVEGIETLSRAKDVISLVLLDVVMPNMNGEEAFHRMKAIAPDMAFIFTSGYSENAFSADFFKKQEVELLEKPYHLSDLLRKIEGLLC